LKWASEGHISEAEAKEWGDGNSVDSILNEKLGFDGDWHSVFCPNGFLFPSFESKVLERFADGSQHVLNHEGVVVLRRPEAGSIPAEISHILKDRASWEEHYKHRLQDAPERVAHARVRVGDEMRRFDQGGLEFLRTGRRDYPYGLHCGSLYGNIRNILGVEGSCYLLADDEALFDEIIEVVGELNFRNVKKVLESGAKFDFGHFWEDICFKNGPLISPAVFAEKVGPQYRRITNLLNEHGVNIVSLDCDGCIDALVPIWLENGVNTVFPIEVGTWNGNIRPWREKYGRELRGVGGMNKNVLARDRAAVDVEIERLKSLVDLGGFIPCPDHRIAPDAHWDLVRYYCESMHQVRL
jgi:uroporphyrinogen decarboxylase